MLIDSLLLYFVVARALWALVATRVLPLCLLALIDLAFFGANVLKFLDGGWFPLLIGRRRLHPAAHLAPRPCSCCMTSAGDEPIALDSFIARPRCASAGPRAGHRGAS